MHYTAGKPEIGPLLSAVPGIIDVAELSGEQISNIDSDSMTQEIWLKIAHRAESLLSDTPISADGPLNLLNAVRLAADPSATNRGVLVCPNNEINGARDATKTTTHALDAFIEAGAKGIVIAGMGNGGYPATLRAPLLEAAGRGIPVVVASRTGSGISIPDDRELISADSLNPQKARVLLMLCLTRTSDQDQIRKMFTEY